LLSEALAKDSEPDIPNFEPVLASYLTIYQQLQQFVPMQNS